MHVLQFNAAMYCMLFLRINSGYLTGGKASFYAACAATKSCRVFFSPVCYAAIRHSFRLPAL